MNVHTITRRTGRGPGDEIIEVVHMSDPVPLDLEPIRSDWTSPSRLHIPRHEPASGGWLLVVAVVVVAFIAAVVGVWK